MQLKEYCLTNIKSEDASIENGNIEGDHILFDGKKYYPIIKSSTNDTIGKIIRTLQVSNGNEDNTIQIVRVSSDKKSILFKAEFNLTSKNYLKLWQGYIYLPPKMGLYCHVSSANVGVSFYASAILQDGITNTSI